MAQPPAYNPTTLALKNWDANLRATLDSEHSNIQTSLDAIISNLGKIQRDDTKLANDSVHVDAFNDDALLLISDWTPRGDWVTGTAYKVKDYIRSSGANYVCVVAHTAGTFATDLASGYWMETPTALAIVDEDDFVSDSDTSAPSQQSTAAYIATQLGDYTADSATDLSAKSWFLDEDDLSSDDDTKAASQQSVKAYVDNNAGVAVEGAQAGDYTLSGGSEVVPIDISIGSIDIDELALGSMDGIVDLVIVADAGDTSANNAELRSSADALVRVIGYQAGDRLRVAYDGTTRRILYGDGPTCPRARAVVAKTADQTLLSRTETLILEANVGEVQDHGNHFASGQYTVPFTGRCRINPYVISDNDGVGLNYQINGTDQKDSSGKGEMPVNAVMEFDVSSGDTIKVLGFANHGGSLDVFGDAAKDETQIIFEMIERHG